jgi:hypothetical protein
MPEVIRAYDTLSKQGVLMLGVNEGERADQAIAYADTVGINFPIVFPYDLTKEQLEQLKESGEVPELVESTEKWQVNNWPTHIFIDSDGEVQAVVIAGLTYESALHYGEMILPDTLPATPIASPDATPAS